MTRMISLSRKAALYSPLPILPSRAGGGNDIQEARAMSRILILALSLAFASGASAQLYRWVDKDGRVRYTDTPPPAGVQGRALQAPAAPPAAAPQGDAKPAPSVSDQEQAFRQRQLEAQKAAEKTAQAQKEAEAKRQNCARAQDYLRTLESGQRVTRTNAQGEREFIDDATRARETASARQAVRDWCD
jgi:hypothetical protein